MLVLSFATPLTVPDAPLGFYVTLELMHVVAGAVAIVMLPALVVREPDTVI